MKPTFFSNQASLRQWFELNHLTEDELIVGFYTVKSGKDSITWSQSVDEALCFGWIDGIRRSVDEESYCIRFTPRRPNSNWSQVNLKKVDALIKAGLMQKAGMDIYMLRKKNDNASYSYENKMPETFSADMEMLFRHNDRAWKYYQSETPSYRKVTIKWVLSAKQEATRLKRLQELIESSASGEKIRALQIYAGKKTTANK
jgi:uncharacterized protein YdeI (YjbR/CyaY-like superfamily)